jgi:hypothetical protein
VNRKLLAIIFWGCLIPSTAPSEHVTAERSLNNWGHKTLFAKLKTGDLVFRNGKGFISNMMRNTSIRSRKYSHVGVVVLENGIPMVYHMMDDINVNASSCDLKKESFESFISSRYNKCIGVYRYPLSKRFQASLRNELNALLRTRPYFDDGFDLKTNNRLYCTELVWKHVLVKGGIQVPVSKSINGDFIGLDDLHLFNSAKLVFQLNYNS